MDLEKKINDLVEEYNVFYEGDIWDFVESKEIHMCSKIAGLFEHSLVNNPMLDYHLDKINQYLKVHPEITYKDLCSYESLWFW